MILQPDLFSFAYVPEWYIQLDSLAEMALPEPWRFRNPDLFNENPDTPILERYIHAIFKKQIIDYKEERDPAGRRKYFMLRMNAPVSIRGLYTQRYKAIYACFERNKKRTPCWSGISRALRTSCPPSFDTYLRSRKSPATIWRKMASTTTRNGLFASTWTTSWAMRRIIHGCPLKSVVRKPAATLWKRR